MGEGLHPGSFLSNNILTSKNDTSEQLCHNVILKVIVVAKPELRSVNVDISR